MWRPPNFSLILTHVHRFSIKTLWKRLLSAGNIKTTIQITIQLTSNTRSILAILLLNTIPLPTVIFLHTHDWHLLISTWRHPRILNNVWVPGMVFRCYGQHHLRYKGSCQVKKSKNLRKTRIGQTTPTPPPPPAYSISIFLEIIRNMKTTQITQKTQNSPQKN